MPYCVSVGLWLTESVHSIHCVEQQNCMLCWDCAGLFDRQTGWLFEVGYWFCCCRCYSRSQSVVVVQGWLLPCYVFVYKVCFCFCVTFSYLLFHSMQSMYKSIPKYNIKKPKTFYACFCSNIFIIIPLLSTPTPAIDTTTSNTTTGIFTTSSSSSSLQFI